MLLWHRYIVNKITNFSCRTNLKEVSKHRCQHKYLIGNVSPWRNISWSYCPYPLDDMLIPMLYFLFLPDAWEAFPYVLILVTNMGTVGISSRYRCQHKYLMGNVSPWRNISWSYCPYPLDDMLLPMLYFLFLIGCMRSISIYIEIGHKYGHSG